MLGDTYLNNNGYKLGDLHILVVDDSQHMRNLMRSIFKEMGFNHIYDAADGEAAYMVLHSTDIDLVFCDWQMEPMDGLEFVQKVRNDPNSPNRFLPIIMVTGHTELFRVMQARDNGVTDFMAKPVSVEALAKRIAAVIEDPRPYVKTDSYFGPCRRRLRNAAQYGGTERREDMIDKDEPAPDSMEFLHDRVKEMLAE